MRDDETFDFKAQAPEVACYGFAIELGLKAIIIAETNKQHQGHDLDVLYRAVSADSKQAISGTVTVSTFALRPGEIRTFDSVLAQHKEVFVEWRYACEGKDLAADIGFLRELAESVLAVADSKIT
ncbi:hypothetical protein ACTSKR_11225 [Chitinibacteraceae bacterium HSL-7]